LGQGQRSGADPEDVLGMQPARAHIRAEVRDHPPVRAASLGIGPQVKRRADLAGHLLDQPGRLGVGYRERPKRGLGGCPGHRQAQQEQPDQGLGARTLPGQPVHGTEVTA